MRDGGRRRGSRPGTPEAASLFEALASALATATEAWHQDGYGVTGTALAARTALRLQETTGVPSLTMARLLGRLDRAELVLTNRDVVVLTKPGWSAPDTSPASSISPTSRGEGRADRRSPPAHRARRRRHPRRPARRPRPGRGRCHRLPVPEVEQVTPGSSVVTQVVIVDDDALARRWLRMIIEPQVDLDVVGEAEDGLAAVSLVTLLRPDVVITDIRMTPLDGIETTRRIQRASAGTKVLVLTTHALDHYLFDSLRAGASGFILKSTPPEEIMEGIRRVASGEGLLSPAMTRRLMDTFAAIPARSAAAASPPADITPREREVLIAVSQGLTNHEISGMLHMSVATTKTHVSRLLTKLGARERAQLVMVAYESGLVAPGGS